MASWSLSSRRERIILRNGSRGPDCSLSTLEYMENPSLRLDPAARLAWFLGLALLTVSASCPARTKHAEKEAELHGLRRQIEALSEHLERARSTESSLQRELRITETSIGETARELQDIDRRLGVTDRRLAALRAEKDRLEKALTAQRQALAKQVRAAYIMGRQDYLKLLLNQEEPSALERVLTYYRYFNRARAEQIQHVESELRRLAAVQQSIRREEDVLRTLQATALERKADQETKRRERARILSRLRRKIEQGGHELDSLKANEKELARLLKALRDVFEDIPKALDRRKSFPQRRGHLPWPSQGPLRHRFGTSRSRGSLRWQGVVIGAKTGQGVTAVHHGRVAFSDWLRGFGLLIIIDHGDGYMSLYGHNQSVLKETGDWVEAGETIATVGDSGGHAEAGLYFEIRRDGIPLNPSRWCVRS